MTTLLIALLVLVVLAVFFALVLCRAAAMGDEQLERAYHELAERSRR